jgi:hypothetical protein
VYNARHSRKVAKARGWRLYLIAACLWFVPISFCIASTVSIPTAQGQKVLYTHSYALIVAEAIYHQPWDVLDQIPREAQNIKAALLRLGFEEPDILIRSNIPSTQLLGVFQAFINNPTHSVDTARLFMFYAGHGYTSPLGQSFVVPVDAPSVTDSDFIARVVPISAIGDVTAYAGARHTLVVFDSCFSGAVFAHRSEEALNLLQFEELSSRRIQVITAGNASQKVPGQSQFVPALIAGALVLLRHF